MFLLLVVLVAILGFLFFSGVLGLHAMLIGSAVVGFIWWVTSVLATTRAGRRTRADDERVTGGRRPSRQRVV